jgi:HlyD family secretion protein
VISSPTNDVGGGTVLLKMADLNLVQVRTLVDETDIGKIQPGQRATVTVEAFPSRPFPGTVLKIEPQAQTEQNVTMFPVLVRIDNKEGLLRPGMNAEVEVHVGRREDVLTVPNAALRTQRDVGSAAQVLGLSPEQVQQQLAAATPGTDSGARGVVRRDSSTARDTSRTTSLGAAPVSARTERNFRGGQRAGGRAGQANRYIVFVRRNGHPTPVWIRTGLTDLDHSEVLEGLTQSDSVFVLPSASLVQSQQESRERVNRITGGGGVPGMQQQPAPGGAARP